MICPKCGSNLNQDGTCPNCIPGNLREMRKEEISGYNGITIDDNSGNTDGSKGYGFRGGNNGNIHRGSYGKTGRIWVTSGNGLLNKLLIGAVIGFVVVGFLFVFLPLAAVAAVVALVLYFLYSTLVH